MKKKYFLKQQRLFGYTPIKGTFPENVRGKRSEKSHMAYKRGHQSKKSEAQIMEENTINYNNET